MLVSACVTAVVPAQKCRGAGVAGLVSEDKGEKGGNLVASRSVPGLGLRGLCYAPTVLGEWFGHPSAAHKAALLEWPSSHQALSLESCLSPFYAAASSL